MKVDLFVIAEKVLKDTTTDKVSVINLLKDVIAESYPTYLPSSSMLIGSSKESGDEGNINTIITVHNNSNEIVKVPIIIDFVGKDKANTILSINGFPVQVAGTLKFTLYKEDGTTELANFIINMKTREIPPTISTQSGS